MKDITHNGITAQFNWMVKTKKAYTNPTDLAKGEVYIKKRPVILKINISQRVTVAYNLGIHF